MIPQCLANASTLACSHLTKIIIVIDHTSATEIAALHLIRPQNSIVC